MPITTYLVEVETPEGIARLLQVEVRCDHCPTGGFTFLIPGHHVRAIRDVCQDALDQAPDLLKAEALRLASTTKIPIDRAQAQKAKDN